MTGRLVALTLGIVLLAGPAAAQNRTASAAMIGGVIGAGIGAAAYGTPIGIMAGGALGALTAAAITPSDDPRRRCRRWERSLDQLGRSVTYCIQTW